MLEMEAAARDYANIVPLFNDDLDPSRDDDGWRAGLPPWHLCL